MAGPDTSPPPPPEDDISDILARYREDEKPDDISDIVSKYAGDAAPSWGDVPLSAVKNLPTSAYNFGHDLIQPFIHPIDTANSVYEIGRGVMQKLGMASGEESIPAANAVGQFLVDRYGSVDAIKNTLATDPVGIAADLSTVLTGGAGAAARVPGLAGKATAAVGAVGRVIDPLSVAAKGIAATRAPELIGKGAAHLVGDLGTHTGAESLNIAAKTGYEGGEAGKVFRENLRGAAPMEDVVEDARRAVGAMREARGQAYRSGMIDISKDRSILNFDKVDDALTRISRVATFGNKQLSPSTQAVRQKIGEVIRDWKMDDPAHYHTPEGFDALKQTLGDILDTTEYGSRERRVANDAYHAVRNTIVAQAPAYAKVMSDYERASNLIREIDRTLSTNPGASVDTALRKLQSVLRNNVNTNYGYRTKLLDQLEAAGAPHLKPAIAGQTLSAVAPRGLGKIVASQAAATLAGHAALGAAGFGVGNAVALPFMSPRLMGEVAHNAGIAARWGKHVLLPHVPLRAGEQATFQAGRSPETLRTYGEGFAWGGRAKPSKAKAHYRLGSKNKRCEICTMFRAPHTCTAIVGKVSKIGLCDLFERKQAYAEGGEVADDSAGPFEQAPAPTVEPGAAPVALTDADEAQAAREAAAAVVARAARPAGGRREGPPVALRDAEGRTQAAYVADQMARGFGDLLTTPGNIAKGIVPATPSEEDQFRADKAAEKAYEWGPGMGLQTVLGGVSGAKPGTIGIGGGKLTQPSGRPSVPPFYSAVEKAVDNVNLPKAPPEQWLGTIRNSPGVKAEELEWIGLPERLGQQQGPVPKQAVQDFIRSNKVDVQEVMKGGGPDHSGGGKTKFGHGDLVLPGGENYRELLLTSPRGEGPVEAIARANDLQRQTADAMADWKRIAEEKAPGHPETLAAYSRLAEIRRARDVAVDEAKTLNAQFKGSQFTNSHWDEPNVLAHIRFNDRNIGGKKTLFLEEIQSDWHQKGRKQGYESPQRVEQSQAISKQLEELNKQWNTTPEAQRGALMEQMNALHDQRSALLREAPVPDAPFKTTWPELSLKRMIRYAAENGYDQISWTPGSVQNKRYNLSSHLKELQYLKNPNGRYEIAGVTKTGDGFNLPISVTAAELPGVVGQEMANKIIRGEGERFRGHPSTMGTFRGIDLQVGGAGMEGFYDKMLPAAANKLGKPHGARVGQEEMYESRLGPFHTPVGQIVPTHTVHTFPITGALREHALGKGFPLFVGGKSVVPVPDANRDDRYARRKARQGFARGGSADTMQFLARMRAAMGGRASHSL